ncbi:MAG: transposase [Pseudonocardiaceae bacterium]
MPKNRRSFTPEYKDEAAKIVVELSRPIAMVARELGLNEQTLRNWGLGSNGRSDTPLS